MLPSSRGSSSHRHRCPGGSASTSAGRQAILRPSSNSTTWFCAHLSPGQRHGEHVADRAHPLAGLGRREVAVAVPRRLPGRVCDQLEDRLGGGLDDPAGADDALLVTHHLTVPRPGSLTCEAGTMSELQVAVVLYDRMTALDVVGPIDVLRFLPGAQLELVSESPGAGPHRQRGAGAGRDHELRRLRRSRCGRRARRAGDSGGARRPADPLAAAGAPDHDLDDVGLLGLPAAGARGAAARSPRRLALRGPRPAAPARRGPLRRARGRRRGAPRHDRGRRLLGHRHGAGAGRAALRHHDRAGDPAGDRVRPAATARHRRPRQGQPRRRTPGGRAGPSAAARSRSAGSRPSSAAQNGGGPRISMPPFSRPLSAIRPKSVSRAEPSSGSLAPR